MVAGPATDTPQASPPLPEAHAATIADPTTAKPTRYTAAKATVYTIVYHLWRQTPNPPCQRQSLAAAHVHPSPLQLLHSPRRRVFTCASLLAPPNRRALECKIIHSSQNLPSFSKGIGFAKLHLKWHTGLHFGTGLPMIQDIELALMKPWLVLISECKHVFEGLTSLVDIAVARAISYAFPDLKFIVLYQHHVVANLEGSQNLEFVGGDMFKVIPSANAILLKNDWNDEQCVKILKKCNEAIPSKEQDRKLIIIDMVMENQKQDHESVATQHLYDILMIVLFVGKERNEKQWAQLFYDAGFNTYKKKFLCSYVEQSEANKKILGHMHMEHLKDISSKELVRGLPKIKFEKDK
ncbi:hypothetical protein RJ640_015797, partial [Escallonia rubra]